MSPLSVPLSLPPVREAPPRSPCPSTLPAGALPAGVALDSVTDALPAVQEAASGLLNQQGGGSEVSAPGTNLLGGLPAGGLTGALPLGALPIGG